MAEVLAAGVEELEAFLADFASRLEPGQRKKMGVRIAAHLQRARAKTIGANVDPDGQPFEPRKTPRPQRGRDKVARKKRSIKNRKMFLRARTGKFLRKQATANEARVGFAGAMARIMTVHQEGLEDHVTRDPSSPVVQYPMRRVLGMNEADRDAILDVVLASLSE
jgi:phage virion morphogenesis protein